MDTFTRKFPVENQPETSEENCEPGKFDSQLALNSYVLVKVKEIRTVSLAKVTTITSSEVLLEILKPKNKSAFR